MLSTTKLTRVLTMLTAAAILLGGCGGTTPPTQDPAVVQATIDAAVAQTLAAQQALATPTQAPSNTPEPTQALDTPTAVLILPTPTPFNFTSPSSGSSGGTSGGGTGGSSGSSKAADYACTWISQSPADYVTMVPRQSFDMKWKIRNTGTKTWLTSGIDFGYVSGERLSLYSELFDLPADVMKGHTIQLIVDMEAPKEPGTYRLTWGLKTGSSVFCKLTLVFYVKK